MYKVGAPLIHNHSLLDINPEVHTQPFDSTTMSTLPRPIAGGGASKSEPAHPELSSFLTLPPEVRNHVYYYLLKQDRPVIVQTSPVLQHCSVARYNARSVSMSIGLLLLCRQLSHEVSSSFYSNNTFLIDCHSDDPWGYLTYPVAFPAFLHSIGSQAHLLRIVLIGVPSDEEHPWQTAELQVPEQARTLPQPTSTLGSYGGCESSMAKKSRDRRITCCYGHDGF